MGYHVIIDILGSVIMAGILLMTLLNMKSANTEKNFKYAGNQILQQNLTTLTEIIDNDFKQIGYGPDSSFANPIQLATSKRIKFFSDVDLNGTKDVVEYNFSGNDLNTPNPKDTILIRTVKDVYSNLNFGITNFKFVYRDVSGNIISSTSTQLQRNSINSIQLDITIQSTSTYERAGVDPGNQYNEQTARWRRIFYPNKTRNR